jgi:putative transposase
MLSANLPAEVGSIRDFRMGLGPMHTCTSIYLHVVFATWSRRASIADELRPRLAYLAATARGLGVADVQVGGHVDHVHICGEFDPSTAPSVVIGRLKQAGTRWPQGEGVRDFRWQRGFGAFSVSRDRVPAVVRYIERQEEHHRKRTFREELEMLLRAHGIGLEDTHLL